MDARNNESVLLDKILEVLTCEEKEDLLRRLKDDLIACDFLRKKIRFVEEKKAEEEEESEETPQEFYPVLRKYMKRMHTSIFQLSPEIGITRNTWTAKMKSGKVLEKKQVLQLCILLRLDINEANYLMCLAGYIFSSYSGTDGVIYECLKKKIYDLAKVDEKLLKQGEQTLFSEE